MTAQPQTGTGRVNPFKAWGWALKAFFTNWKTWVPIGIVTAIAFIFPLLPLLLSPMLVIFALRSIKERTWSLSGMATPNYGKTLAVTFFTGLFAAMLMFLLFVLGFSLADSLSSGPDIEHPLVAAAPGVLGFLVLTPFCSMLPFYAADVAAGEEVELQRGTKDIGRNLLPLIAMVAVSFVLSVAGTLLFLVGLVVVVPFTYLSMAHAYRQACGGPLP